MTDGAHALGDLRALPGEALGLLARGFHSLCALFQARGPLWRAARAALCRRVVGDVETLMHPLARLFSLANSLFGGTLFAGHGSGDGLAEFMLHMEEVRRVMRPKVVFNIGQKPWSLITGRLNDRAVETRKGRRHERVPGVVITRRCQLFQENGVAHGFYAHQAQTAWKRFI